MVSIPAFNIPPAPMDLVLLLGSLLALPAAFILYRKLEFYARVRKARARGNYYVQKPIVIGVLKRWLKKQPLDVNFYNSLFRKYGRTFTTHPFLRPLVMTTEPENVKTILATKFGEFDIGKVRTEVGQKYMRKGIFTTMGNDWHVSEYPARTYETWGLIDSRSRDPISVLHLTKPLMQQIWPIWRTIFKTFCERSLQTGNHSTSNRFSSSIL